MSFCVCAILKLPASRSYDFVELGYSAFSVESGQFQHTPLA